MVVVRRVVNHANDRVVLRVEHIDVALKTVSGITAMIAVELEDASLAATVSGDAPPN